MWGLFSETESENNNFQILTVKHDLLIKIRSILITNHLSISEHVCDVITKYGHTMYVLKVFFIVMTQMMQY